MVSLPIQIPPEASILVKEGEKVKKGQLLAKREASDEHVIHLAEVLQVKPENVQEFLLRKPGDSIKQGEIIATRKKALGFTTIKIQSNVSGMITGFDEESGDVTVGGDIGGEGEAEILCPIDGTVSVCNNEQIVIQTNQQLLEGVSGVGSTASGIGYILPSVKNPQVDQLQMNMQLNSSVTNAIVVGREFHRDALIKAIGLGASGIIAVTILPEDIEYLNQRNMLIPIILVDEEGLRSLISYHNKQLYLDGATHTIVLLG